MAVSPDKPENLKPTSSKHKLGYALFSDAKSEAAMAYGIAFQVDQKTYEQYKGYGIDLEEASGEKHHLLPVPAVFLYGKSGKLEFEYVNPDYRIRLAPKVLLAAAQAALE